MKRERTGTDLDEIGRQNERNGIQQPHFYGDLERQIKNRDACFVSLHTRLPFLEARLQLRPCPLRHFHET